MWGASRERFADKRNIQEKRLHTWRGVAVRDVLRYFEEDEEDEVRGYGEDHTTHGLFGGFLSALRDRGIRVSIPEWVNFLSVLRVGASDQRLRNAADLHQLFERIRVYARITLIKNKQDEVAFHEVFDQYFLHFATVIAHVIAEKERRCVAEGDQNTFHDSASDSIKQTEVVAPDIKTQQDIQDVDETLEMPSREKHDDNDQVHGGKKDQHNDVLKKEDPGKLGGGKKEESQSGGEGNKGEKDKGKGEKGDAGAGKGEKGDAGAGKGEKGDAGAGKGEKGQPSGMGMGSGRPGAQHERAVGQLEDGGGFWEKSAFQDVGMFKGKGKGNSRNSAPGVIESDQQLSVSRTQIRAEAMQQYDGRKKYERRPTRADLRQIILGLRRIIQGTSRVRGKEVDTLRTVENFAKKNLQIEYRRERKKQQKIVLFIDTGGPVDEWAPLIRELAEEMTRGLTRLEVYLFHNNLYGYVWKANQEDWKDGAIKKPREIYDVRKIVTGKCRVIIYGDAEMGDWEFKEDRFAQYNNQEQVRQFGIPGDDCLRWIMHRAEHAVWVNPIFRSEWEGERNNSGTISAVRDIVPMYDLSVGGLQDAVKELIK